ncbi:Uncharacterised protein [Klebsiella pneumoniae]|nr:Uncharacterised protein [Klebsiella pneumoniae]
MRGLQQRQLLILQEGTNGGLQEGAGGDVVAVKYADQLTLGDFHRVVEVTGFGVAVVITGDIADANVCGEAGEFAALAIVQQVDLDLVARVVDALRGQNGVAHHVEAFVVARYVDIDGRPQADIVRQRLNGSLKRP